MLNTFELILDACESFFKALIAITKIETNNPLHDLDKLINAIVDEYWVNLYFNLGMALFELKKPCSALACFRKVLEMGIERDRAYMMMAFCYCRAGRPRLAIPIFQKSLAINPHETTTKTAYDKVVGMVAHLSSSNETMTIDDVLEYEFVDKKTSTDYRPNLGRHLLNTSMSQSYKINSERTFRILRSSESQKKQNNADDNNEVKTAVRFTGCKSQDESLELLYPSFDQFDRPGTAPATMEVIEEDMPSDDGLEVSHEHGLSSNAPNDDDSFLRPRVLDFNTTSESDTVEAASSRGLFFVFNYSCVIFFKFQPKN